MTISHTTLAAAQMNAVTREYTLMGEGRLPLSAATIPTSGSDDNWGYATSYGRSIMESLIGQTTSDVTADDFWVYGFTLATRIAVSLEAERIFALDKVVKQVFEEVCVHPLELRLLSDAQELSSIAFH